MSNDDSKNTSPQLLSRRKMLMRLGLAATAVYAAPMLLQLSEARASGLSGPSKSGPGRRRRRGAQRVGSPPSFSDGRRRTVRQGQAVRRPRVASFSR